MNTHLVEKYALITGATSGIGQELIQNLLNDGWFVFGVSLNGLMIDHEAYTDVLCDLRDEEAVEELFQIVSEKTAELQLVVHLAGLFQMSSVLDTSSRECKDLLETNVIGSFHLFKHVFNYLIEDISHLVVITNPASVGSLSNLGTYGASQSGMLHLFESLKEEWGHLNYRFSSLIIDPVNSTLWDQLELEVPREEMLSIEDVNQVIMMVINSPENIEFPRLVVKNVKARAPKLEM